MTGSESSSRGLLWRPLFALVLALALPALALTVTDAVDLASADEWQAALFASDGLDPAALLARHVFLPRIAVALLAGAGLALAGAILQQALRNPLADPTTLGTAAGAGLALTAATLYAPALLLHGREPVALAGAVGATLLAFGLSARRSFSPVTLILSGLVVTLVAGSAAATLMALKSDYVTEIFVWQSGSLIQNGNAAAIGLCWQLIIAFVISWLLVRPLSVIGLDDQAAAALGASPARIRLVAVAIGVALSAMVTAAVGVIAFVGLAAPTLARACGARTVRSQMAFAPPVGAFLLLLTDRVVERGFDAFAFPTGAATAIIGAPLLFLLLPRLRNSLALTEAAVPSMRSLPRSAPVWSMLGVLVLVALAIGFGRGVDGWKWLAPSDWATILPLRAPRVLAAASCGILLATAGLALQRVTANPMASPEFLGVSGGATLGVVALLFLSTGIDRFAVFGAASMGAFFATILVLTLSHRGQESPERVLLLGIATATLATSLSAVVLASGDPRVQWLQSWLTGSTYRVEWPDAAISISGAVTVAVLSLFMVRWLDILPLGPSLAGSLGVPTRRARLSLITVAAAATATATITVGPLSFVGLLAPHLASMAGLRRSGSQFAGAALIGATIMVAADWLGRNMIFPWQIPAGLLSAVIGAPAFAWLIRRRN